MKKSVKITLLSVAGVLLACLIGAAVVYKLPIRYEEKFQAYPVTGEAYSRPVSVELRLNASYSLLSKDSVEGIMTLEAEDGLFDWSPQKYPCSFQPVDYDWGKKVSDHMKAKFSLAPSQFSWNQWIPAEKAGSVTNTLAKSGEFYENKGKFCVSFPVEGKSRYYFGPADSPEEAREIYEEYFQGKSRFFPSIPEK